MRVKTIRNNVFNMEQSPDSIPDFKVDATFRKIPKHATCFAIWKIDENRLDSLLKANYGTFHDDAAYIVYAAGQVDSYVTKDTLARELKKGVHIQRFIHFWLGTNVSEQTRSNVAYKIKELDSYFGNVAAQYRETQHNESARFLSYFKGGIVILSGKIISAPKYPRMYQFFGRKCLRCVEMESVSWGHFDSSYVILVRTEKYSYIWLGRSSSIIERRLALEHVLNNHVDGTVIVIIDDGYEQALTDEMKTVWNSLLSLSQRNVTQTMLAASSSSHFSADNKMSIYKCVHREGRLNLDQLELPVFPSKDELNDQSSVYLLDCQRQGVWMWVGSLASHQDKLNALGNARAYVKKKKYPFTTPVMRVVEGNEPVEFTRLFPHWNGDFSDTFASKMRPVSSMLGKFDALTLCQRPKMAADTQIVDDGRGERTIYRLTKDEVVEVIPTKLTIFTTTLCYIIKYTVVYASVTQADVENVGIRTIIYQWNGAESNADLIGKADNFARKLFQSCKEKAMFVQMSEFDETPHFLQIFDGKLIIMQNDVPLHHHKSGLDADQTASSLIKNIKLGGGNSNMNGNNNKEESNKFDKTSISLIGQKNYTLKVYGNASYNSKAVEVYPLSSLNSKDCYIVKRNHIWVWCGQSSTGDAREMAKSIGNMLGECSLVLEGKEPKEFWVSDINDAAPPLILGSANGSIHNNSPNGNSGSASPQSVGSSNGGYSSGYVTPPTKLKHRFQPQLFLIWMHRKDFFCQEIFGFEQNDLNPECMYVLDAGLIIFIWLGAHCYVTERERYLSMAQHYIEQIPIARRPTTALAVIRQNDEPNIFKGFFESWNHNLWKDFVSFEAKRKDYSDCPDDASSSNGSSVLHASYSFLNNQKDFDTHTKYPICVLQQEIDNLPPEVNPLKREVHLTHDDFVSIFKMSFCEFSELPIWKQKEMKKLNKLF